MSVDPALSPEPTGIDVRRLALRLGAGLVVTFVVVMAAVAVLEGPITALSLVFVSRYGLLGVLAGALLCDLLAVPKEPVMLMGVLGGLGVVEIVLAGSAATLLAAGTGWALGQRFGRVPAVARWLDRAGVGPLLHRYGARAVALAAVAPFPFAAMTWAAGAVRMPFGVFALGALFRIPKLLVLFGMVLGGSELGSALGR